jgi:two-component system, cell cycle response regulator CpdR
MAEREEGAAEGGAASTSTSISPWEAARRLAGGRPILVVDDDEAVRGFVASALRSGGYEVHAADSGRSAIQIVFGESAPFALLLTDVDMPGMSGIELAARLSAERPGLRVLLMTGRPDMAEQARDRAFIAGVLLKPFTLSELRDAVSRAIGTGAG